MALDLSVNTTGSIPLTGGHGTAAAFGPLLEERGLEAGMSVAVAAATFGLVAGSMLGGPVARRLLHKYHLHPKTDAAEKNTDMTVGEVHLKDKLIREHKLFLACACIILSMGLGSYIIMGFKALGIVLPAYLGPMMVAAVFRNINDYFVTGRRGEALTGIKRDGLPLHTISVLGELALHFFLAMALMTMRLWELASLAIPLITILLVQTVMMGLYAYFVTFNIMGRDYDAAVIACGHCGFGMGATPNAMANMDTFTGANFPSPKAFFVVPLVGALFIDFVNAFVITFFLGLVS